MYKYIYGPNPRLIHGVLTNLAPGIHVDPLSSQVQSQRHEEPHF